jgi:predicted alpha/beta hydrolase
MSERNVDSIHALYSGVERRRIRIRPEEVDERSIGHFGFFRRRFEASLWRNVLLPELA